MRLIIISKIYKKSEVFNVIDFIWFLQQLTKN